MFSALLILQVVLGLSIIGLVLLQQGKGADMGAAFGAGASGSVFGARGGSSFFTRTTAILATAFFANSILLSSPLVHDARDPNVSVTTSAPEVEVEETDVPDLGEAGIDSAMDLPPADLPDSEAAADDAAADLPDVEEPADMPAPASEKPE